MVDMLEASVPPVVGAMVACGRGAKWVAGRWAMVAAVPLGVRARSTVPARGWCDVIAGVVKGESTMVHAPVWSMGVAMVRVGVVGWCRVPGGRSAPRRERALRVHTVRVCCEGGCNED